MWMPKSTRHCPDCRKRTLHDLIPPDLRWAAWLVLLTCGFFILVWILASFCYNGPWRCQLCGHVIHPWPVRLWHWTTGRRRS